MALSLQEAFSSEEDPRVERHKRHQLMDIIILTVCAVISGAEGWDGKRLSSLVTKNKTG